jgi:hypothetical protein
MGQHRRDIQRIYQPPVKNSQSAFRQNPRDALQTQGSGLAMSKLWDGSETRSKIRRAKREYSSVGELRIETASTVVQGLECLDSLEMLHQKAGLQKVSLGVSAIRISFDFIA